MDSECPAESKGEKRISPHQGLFEKIIAHTLNNYDPCIDAVIELARHGANPDFYFEARGEHMSLLSYLCRSKNSMYQEIAAELIKMGANVALLDNIAIRNIMNSHKQPLHHLVPLMKGMLEGGLCESPDRETIDKAMSNFNLRSQELLEIMDIFIKHGADKQAIFLSAMKYDRTVVIDDLIDRDEAMPPDLDLADSSVLLSPKLALKVMETKDLRGDSLNSVTKSWKYSNSNFNEVKIQVNPLNEAIKLKSLGVIKLLLLRGASVNIDIALGRTPLGYALAPKPTKEDVQIVRLLLAYGADRVDAHARCTENILIKDPYIHEEHKQAIRDYQFTESARTVAQAHFNRDRYNNIFSKMPATLATKIILFLDAASIKVIETAAVGVKDEIDPKSVSFSPNRTFVDLALKANSIFASVGRKVLARQNRINCVERTVGR